MSLLECTTFLALFWWLYYEMHLTKKSFRVVLRMCLFVDCCGFWQKLWWNTISMRLLPCLQRKSQLTWPIIKAENHSSSLLDYNQKISFLQLQPYATPDITHCGEIRFLTKKNPLCFDVEVDKIKFYFLVKNLDWFYGLTLTAQLYSV